MGGSKGLSKKRGKELTQSEGSVLGKMERLGQEGK